MLPFCAICEHLTPQLRPYPLINKQPCSEWICAAKELVLITLGSLLCRVKELTVDPNQVIEGGRPNIHAGNQLDLLDEEWLSMSPQRDDLKLLCEQNVSTWDTFKESTFVFGNSNVLWNPDFSSDLKKCHVSSFCCYWSHVNSVSYPFTLYKCFLGGGSVSPAVHLPWGSVSVSGDGGAGPGGPPSRFPGRNTMKKAYVHKQKHR